MFYLTNIFVKGVICATECILNMISFEQFGAELCVYEYLVLQSY